MYSYLTRPELRAELGRRTGLIPIGLDINRGRLIWQDLEQYHNYEGFFSTSVNTFANLKSLNGGQPAIFESDLDALESDEILTDFIRPTGFIFHASRCGSTLLSKSLAKSRSNLVFGEAAPHNLIWPFLTNGWSAPPEINDRNKTIYKNLLLAMGRKRLSSHVQHFIKFTSFNIMFFDFVKATFPDVPAIFIYRDPDAIKKSLCNRPPGWLSESPMKAFITGIDRQDGEAQDKSDFIERALTRFFTAAVDAGQSGLRYIHYEQLRPENLPTLLSALNAVMSPEALALLQNQFRYDSKSDYKLREFTPNENDGSAFSEKEYSISSSNELKELYNRLLKSEMNLIRSEVLIGS